MQRLDDLPNLMLLNVLLFFASKSMQMMCVVDYHGSTSKSPAV